MAFSTAAAKNIVAPCCALWRRTQPRFVNGASIHTLGRPCAKVVTIAHGFRGSAGFPWKLARKKLSKSDFLVTPFARMSRDLRTVGRHPPAEAGSPTWCSFTAFKARETLPSLPLGV
jgi:hypothetical protein